MTDTPDPGLTDLIAAHQAGDRWTDFQYPSIFSDKPFVATAVTKMVNCSCGESMPAESHPVHVALVVEQHTNGRTAELGWDELVAAIPDGWELQESAQLEEVSRVRQRDLEASQATTARWRARADKAEAAIAKVEAEAALLERMIRTAPWSRYTEVRRSHLRSLCAALEGPGRQDEC